jgi:thiol-disulfide isomerase/thioredoxin
MKQILTYLFIFLGLISQSACIEQNNSKRKLSEEEQTTSQATKKTKRNPFDSASLTQKNGSQTVQEIKTIDELLQKLTAKQLTIIMGSMNGCHFCKKAEPIFKKYAQEYPDINFYTTNGLKTNMAREVNKLDSTIKIRGYPAFLFIKDGKINDHLLGVNIEQLDNKIKALE